MLSRAREGPVGSTILAIMATMIAAGVMLWIAAKSSDVLQPPARIPLAVAQAKETRRPLRTGPRARLRRPAVSKSSRRSARTRSAGPLSVVQVGGSIAIPSGLGQGSRPPSSTPVPGPSATPAPRPSHSPAPGPSPTPGPSPAPAPPTNTTTSGSPASPDQSSSSSSDTTTTSSPDGASTETVTTTTSAGGS
jgi:hypothetical protein